MAGVPVFRSVFSQELQETLAGIALDEIKTGMGNLTWKKHLHEDSSNESQFVDYHEFAGPGLAGEKVEGGQYPTGGLTPGQFTRIYVKPYGLKMGITKEAARHNKYPEIYKAAPMLTRAFIKLTEYEAAGVLIFMFNSAYTGGREGGTALASASQVQPNGDTVSNLMATPITPSAAAIISARIQTEKWPSRDGLLGDGFKLKKIHCPVDQTDVWNAELGSKLDTTLGNASKINVVNTYGLEVCPNVYWSNTTTNYAFGTDAYERTGFGGIFLWDEKPNVKQWIENSDDNMWHRVYGSFGTGWNDWRWILGVNL